MRRVRNVAGQITEALHNAGRVRKRSGAPGSGGRGRFGRRREEHGQSALRSIPDLAVLDLGKPALHPLRP
jgi:hypothetical protein